MPDLVIAGHRAHLADAGSGPPVVLLHSGGLSGGQWRRLTERLQPTHRVLVPDFLGMGESEPWPAAAPFSFTLDVDLAEAVISLATEPVHLVGHSYGGLIALHAARRAPSRVRSLTLCEPVAFGVLPPGDLGRDELDRSAAQRLPPTDAEGGGEAWLQGFIDYWNGPGGWARLPLPQREAFLRVGRKLYLEVTSLSDDRTPASAYAGVTCSTLLLSGSASTVAANRVCAVLAQALPQARHEILPGATHMAPIIEAKRVNELILHHLESV